jgi:hypothetical protein
MKKKFAIILCLFMAIRSFANESVESKKNEIQLKFGMMPLNELVLYAFAHPDPSMPLFPVVTGEYLYYLNPNNGIGCSLSIWSAISISARFSYRRIYMNKENIKLYGEVGIGAELLLLDLPWFSVSVSPIGIWWGSDDLFGTAELTIGSEGNVATIGIGKRF